MTFLRGARTPVYIAPQVKAIVDMLNDANPKFPVDYWFRPKDPNEKFEDPPYLLVRVYPSADQMTGALSDTQTDTIIRVQLMAAGRTDLEALNVLDWARGQMQRATLEPYLEDENRAVMDLRLMVSSAGTTRDDDLPTPMFVNSDLYELRTCRLTRNP